MGVISWIILGLIAGFIGSKIVNKTGSGMLMDIALGVVGAIVGGLIFSGIFGMTGVTGLNILEPNCRGCRLRHRVVDLPHSRRANLRPIQPPALQRAAA